MPYVWSRISSWGTPPGDATGGTSGYSVTRFRRGASSRFSVRPDLAVADDPLSIHVTARFGLHSRFYGRTIHISNTHEPWALHRADLHELHDGLISAAGIEVSGPPESVLYSPGVRTQFGWPRVVAAPAAARGKAS